MLRPQNPCEQLHGGAYTFIWFVARKRRSASLQERQIVGASVPRKEGWDKVTGAARYVDDMVLPGMLYGATVRSNVARDRKSTRLNSSHANISYAVFCLKKKKKYTTCLLRPAHSSPTL